MAEVYDYEISAPEYARPSPLRRRVHRAALASLAVIGAGIVLSQQNSRIDALKQRQDKTSATLNKQLAGLTLEGQEVQALLRLSGVSPNELQPFSLKPLTPTKSSVDSRLTDEHYGAALELVYRSKFSNSKTHWSPICSADKVSFNGQDYVLTANHCFWRQEPIKGGGNAQAVNITDELTYSYAVAAPRQSTTANQPWDIVGNVTAVAVDMERDADWALLKVTPTGKANNGYYQQQPALSLSDEQPLEGKNLPIQPLARVGEPASIVSMPAANNFEMVIETGTYLGRTIRTPSSLGVGFDVVGITPSQYQADGCNYGSSGSVAVLDNGVITGPLSWRNTTGYGPNQDFFYPDNAKNDEAIRLEIQADAFNTMVNLGEFTTLCFFSSPTEYISGNSATATTTMELLAGSLAAA